MNFKGAISRQRCGAISRSVSLGKLLLLLLLFLLAMLIPPAVAQISPLRINSTQHSKSIVQAQSSSIQLVQQARTFYNTGQYQEAASLLEQAAAAFATQGDKLNQAMALSNLAATLGQLQAWEQAEQAVNSSLSLLQSQPKTPESLRILAQTQDIQAQFQLERGRVEDALDTWTQAIKLYQQIDAKDKIIQTQINQSLALQALGLYPRACETLLASLKLETATCEVSEAALSTLKNQPAYSVQNVRAMNSLGHVLRVLGQLEQSQQVLWTGLQAAQKLGMAQEQAPIYVNLGNTARAFASQPALGTEQRSQFDHSALEAYTQAIQLATRSETQLQAQLNQLSLLVERKNWSEAEILWLSLQPQASKFPFNRSGLYAQVNLAQSLMKLVPHSSNATLSFGDIDQILKQANQQATRLGDELTHAYILGSEGRLSELQQQWSLATTFTTQALSLAPPFQSPEIAYQLLWQLGRISKAQGDTEGAVEQYSQAVNILASLRGDLVTVTPEVQFSFRESVEPIYRELVGLLLQEESPSQTKLKQARQTIEYLQLAELDNFFRDACADAKPKLIDEIDPTAAVIYPIILSDRLEVILSIHGKPLRHYTTQKSQAELASIFNQARVSLRRTAFSQERLPLAQQIYDWLIRPAEQDLVSNGIKTLVFILDGSLRNLPMATLHDGQQYLIQKYSIAVTPGLQLLASRPIAQVKLRALTAALTEARQGFPPLPGVASEVQQISAEVQANILVDRQFIAQALQNQIKTVPFSIIHFATHGQFSSNAAETFILTWDDRINVKEFDQLLRSRSQKNQTPIELLVLSACETAAGDERAALGLAGMAIRSGARSTVATLWQVNDESTAIFMAEFYRELAKSKISKAEAIRNAQLALLQNKKYQNPYFWAPFVLVGNWQ